MTLVLYTQTDTPELAVVTESDSRAQQKQRILAALGNEEELPLVDEEALFRYFEYLSENLSLPFDALGSDSTTLYGDTPYECTVQELLDPSRYFSDPFDGILCRTQKAGFEANLPLLELEVSQNDPNFQLIEDYWYWFWNWRCR